MKRIDQVELKGQVQIDGPVVIKEFESKVVLSLKGPVLLVKLLYRKQCFN